MTKKIGKRVGIHFYENVLSEMNFPLLDTLFCTEKSVSFLSFYSCSHDYEFMMFIRKYFSVVGKA